MFRLLKQSVNIKRALEGFLNFFHRLKGDSKRVRVLIRTAAFISLTDGKDWKSKILFLMKNIRTSLLNNLINGCLKQYSGIFKKLNYNQYDLTRHICFKNTI